MAVTKTHPIKSTLKAAIDYILNPEKTDGKLLASSFGCGLETADIEFAWTREAAGDRGTHLGRHLIQSFAVGETTPEEAHKIGMELAGAVLGGKYEFVLTTHVDKDHLHNHLIFNAVSFVDYKKYHSNKQSYHFIRRTSDRICKEHGLSVVVPGQDKGKSYAEYTAEKQGTSYKAKLKTAIDTLIPQVKDFDELLRRLQEMGYEMPGIFGDSCRLLLLRGFFALYGVVRHEHTVYFEIVGVLLRDRRGDFRKQAVIRFDTPIQILFHSCLVGENLSILSGNLRLGSAWAVGAHAPCKRP